MAGLLAPYDAYDLIKALKEKIHIPIHLHTHYTSGMASMTLLKAIEAGIDNVDTCLSPFAMRTSQPAIEPLTVTLMGTERDPGLDLNHLLKLSEYFEYIAPRYREHFDTSRGFRCGHNGSEPPGARRNGKQPELPAQRGRCP